MLQVKKSDSLKTLDSCSTAPHFMREEILETLKTKKGIKIIYSFSFCLKTLAYSTVTDFAKFIG